jgi:hypothetical protein
MLEQIHIYNKEDPPLITKNILNKKGLIKPKAAKPNNSLLHKNTYSDEDYSKDKKKGKNLCEILSSIFSC